jgi:hypothetical protein
MPFIFAPAASMAHAITPSSFLRNMVVVRTWFQLPTS